MKGVIAAHRGSRELSYLSTARYVSGLNFRVRNGSGCVPAAVAAITGGRKLRVQFSPQEVTLSGGLPEVEDQRSPPQAAIPTVCPPESQGPDLNRSVVALQATAWPLRHLGLYVRLVL